MSFASVYLLVGLAICAETSLQKLNKHICQSLLLLPSPVANRAVQAPLCFLSVFLGNRGIIHSSPLHLALELNTKDTKFTKEDIGLLKRFYYPFVSFVVTIWFRDIKRSRSGQRPGEYWP
jgi:hypothetical protein